jgi:hypothetical protein
MPSPTYTFNVRKDQRSASGDQSGPIYRRTYILEVDVRVSEAAAYAWVISPSGGNLPYGSDHPDDPARKLSSLNVEDEAADGKTWKVTAEWKTPGTGSLSEDPLSRAPEIEWSQDKETVTVFKDRSPTPKEVKNSAGDAFDDLPSKDQGVWSVRYVRNETVAFYRGTVLPLLANDLVVNSSSFAIDGVTIPAKMGRLQIQSAPRMTEGSTTFYRVTYVLTVRKGFPGYEAEGWREYFLDRGYYALTGSGKKDPCIDEQGQIVEKPWPLDGSGGQQPNADSAAAVLGPFRFYDEVSFAPLAFT